MADVTPTVAEQRDVRSCEVLESNQPRFKIIETQYTVVIQGGRVHVLLVEGKWAGLRGKPSADNFEPSQPGLSYRQEIGPPPIDLKPLEPDPIVSTVQRAEMFSDGRVVIESWITWLNDKNSRDVFDNIRPYYERVVLRCLPADAT